MQSKTEKLRLAWSAGDRREALRIASRFFDRSPETKLFQQAQSALNNPTFYRQLGKDPDRIAANAYAALSAKFNLPL